MDVSRNCGGPFGGCPYKKSPTKGCILRSLTIGNSHMDFKRVYSRLQKGGICPVFGCSLSLSLLLSPSLPLSLSLYIYI